jgi:hypothetical protein
MFEIIFFPLGIQKRPGGKRGLEGRGQKASKRGDLCMRPTDWDQQQPTACESSLHNLTARSRREGGKNMQLSL